MVHNGRIDYDWIKNLLRKFSVLNGLTIQRLRSEEWKVRYFRKAIDE